MKLFSAHKGNELVLLLDIGSASVGGALVSFSSDSTIKPVTVFATRSELVFQEDLNFESFLSLMLSSLTEVITRIHDARVGAPQSIHCFLAAPWYASQSRIITLSKETPFVFTKKLADELIGKEVISFENEYARKYTSLGQKVRTLEKKIVRVMLNGYHTHEPIGLKAKELSMNLYVSISPESILHAIEEAIQKQFHISKINYSSFSFVSFITTRDMFIHENSFLVVDIGGEISEVSVIKNDMLMESISFPYGKNTLLRKISKGMGKSGSEALSLFKMHEDSKLEASIATVVSRILNEAQSEWLKLFGTALSDIAKETTIPDIVFVTADRDAITWFSHVLESEEFHQYTTTERQFRIIPLNSQALSDRIDFKQNVLRDPFLMLETIFMTRLKIQ